MKFSVQVTAKAQHQLLECARWWSEHRDADQAIHWLDGFEAAIAALSVRAEGYGYARENDLHELPFPVRQMAYGVGAKPTHRAVFEVRGDTVYVVAVRHLAQDDLSPGDL